MNDRLRTSETQALDGGDPGEPLRVIAGEPPADPHIGRTIDGRYVVESVLGEGGMGIVYKAKHIVLGKALAIKVLRPDVSRDEEIITRFRQEAQSASSIGNQHIIDISDFGSLPDGSTYFVMEFLNGAELTQLIEADEPIEHARTVHIAKQLCDALSAAHEAGIVHRDLKPDNISLIRRGGDSNFVKILDFGIAKVGGSSSKLTRAGQVFGTPHYMSPEQCSGTGVTHQTDIYAIGVILYEMITGTVPFDADNLMGILTKHLYEEPRPPRELRPDVPPDLEKVVLRCMSKSTEQRYQSMHEVLEDLLRLEQGIAPLPMPTRTDPTGSLRFMTSGMQAVEPPPRSKLPLVAAVMGAIVLFAGGAGLYVALSGDAPVAQPAVELAPDAPIAVAPSVAPPVVEEEPVEPAAALVSPPVTIISVPEGSQVWRGNVLLGNTPLALPRPAPGEPALELELRRAGYTSQTFAISDLTLDDELTLRLEQERPSRGQRVRAPSQPDAPTPPPVQRRVPVTSEVLDPWANPN